MLRSSVTICSREISFGPDTELLPVLVAPLPAFKALGRWQAFGLARAETELAVAVVEENGTMSRPRRGRFRGNGPAAKVNACVQHVSNSCASGESIRHSRQSLKRKKEATGLRDCGLAR